VSNPEMSQQIKEIILESKESLIESMFQNNRQNFEQYKEEKSELFEKLLDL
jgi:hypothetical protein